MSSNVNPVILVFEAFLVLAASVVNALDPSYQPYYTAFGTLVTVQAVAVAVGWASVHHAEVLFLGTLSRALAFVCFILSLFATVQASRDLGHCLENTGEDRSNANACIDLWDLRGVVCILLPRNRTKLIPSSPNKGTRVMPLSMAPTASRTPAPRWESPSQVCSAACASTSSTRALRAPRSWSCR